MKDKTAKPSAGEPIITIQLTEEQQKQIARATGKLITELKVGAVEERANPSARHAQSTPTTTVRWKERKAVSPLAFTFSAIRSVAAKSSTNCFDGTLASGGRPAHQLNDRARSCGIVPSPLVGEVRVGGRVSP